jgi:hypothetical protein
MTAQSRMLLATVVFLGTSGRVLFSQSAPQLSPGDLIKAVIQTELNSPGENDIRWKYVLDKDADGKQETREVVETKSGSLDHLIAVAGKPLSDAQQHDESQRILNLAHSPQEQRKLELSHKKDAEQCTAFMKMIPDAFVFDYAGGTEHNGLVKLTFKPNPAFQPPSREGKVLHQMAGEMWVDVRQRRLVSINAQLLNEVKFAGGLLGHLERGGRFSVARTEIAPGHWEMTAMEVNMRGKALLFKTISVQQKEAHRDFESVPEDLTIADAAALLMKQSLVAAKQ